MLVLFFKATPDAGSPRRPDKEAPADKMRRILETHVDEAKTDEERERSERELRKFTEPCSERSTMQ